MTRQLVKLEPPGEIIREELDARGWTQADLAEITQRPVPAINEIVNGKRKITSKTARELEAAFGVSAQFWLNLETNYQLSLSTGSDATTERAKLMGYAPIKEMQRREWLPTTSSIDELRDAVLSFFRVHSLDESPLLTAAFRQSAEQVTSSHVAWCTRAMQKAAAQRVQAFRPSRAEELRSRLRGLAAHAEEIRRVPSILAEFGIRFVVIKHLQSTKADGATLWLDVESNAMPVIVLSLRYGRIDNFWHTLCHEVSHVVHGDSFRLDVDLADATVGGAKDEIEERANEEAAATLIPPDELQSFILRKRPYFSAKSIIQFANKISIHPGVIVGQLQYKKAIKYSHSNHMLISVRDIINETSVTDGWIM